MRFRVARLILTLALLAPGLMSLTSCGPDAPPAGGGSADSRLTSAAAEKPPGAPRAVSSLTGGNRAAARDPENFDSPVPPADALWTLLAYNDNGPTHVTDANALKNALIQKYNRHDWYVIHSRDESNVYFGYYRAFDDPKDPATKFAQADKTFVKNIELPATDGQPFKPFEHCGFVPIAAPDPVEPPEWNLFNKDRDKAPKDPARAYWSLQIMAFRIDPRRKEAAVSAVAFLRKKGVEAYYYHGDTISSVCIGSWPMDAVESQQFSGNHTVAGDQDTIVVYNSPQPAGVPKIDHDDQGHKVVELAPVLNIKDPTLKQAIAQYPYHAVNYEIHTIRGTDGKDHEDPSFLVVIPRAPGNGFYDSGEVTPADLAAADQEPWHNRSQANANLYAPSGPAGSVTSRPPDAVGAYPDAPPPAATPGVGHLRRLGD